MTMCRSSAINTQTISNCQARSVGIKASWQDRRKYFHTLESDEVVKHAYHLWNDFGNKKSITAAATQLGWPKYVVRNRARVLGLAKTKESPWSAAEEQIVEQWGWMSLPRIALKLRRAGYRRSETAIHLKMKRLRVKKGLDGHTMRQLAELLGIDDHKIALWIKRGLLRGRKTGIAVGQNEKLFISREDVRRFVLHNPDEIELHRVEKFWFLDMISDGKLCEEFRQEVA